MKNIFFAGLLLSALASHAQDDQLTDRAFWKEKPELSAVQLAIDKGFDFKSVHGATDPLFLAISNDAPATVIKLLINQPGVDFKHTTVEGRIYLHIAANKGNADITDYLISKGSDVNMLDANGHTALTFAAFQGNLTIPLIEVFAKHGVDIKQSFKNKEGANLIMLEVPYDKDLIMTNYLVSKGVSLNAKDGNGYTAFDHAAKIGNVEIMKALNKKGVSTSGNALLIASQGTYRSANKIEVFKYLIEELKMNPLATNKAGQNVLHGVSRKQNQDDIISYFLEKGVDVNQVDKDGNTPFINAAGGKSLAVVEMMLPKVKNINALNSKGESALLSAVKSSTADVVALLLKSGADVKVMDKEGKNLVYHLVDSYRPAGGGRFGRGAGAPAGAPQNSGAAGNVAAARPQQKDEFSGKLQALQAKGLIFNAPLKGGNTMYHLAAAKNDVEILKKISGLGIDVNAKNDEGITALHKAAMVAKDAQTMKYLLSLGANKETLTSMDETAYDLAKDNDLIAQGNVAIDFLK
jgi:ankyrin repeat protein